MNGRTLLASMRALCLLMLLSACGSESRRDSGDASVPDAGPGDASEAPSACIEGLSDAATLELAAQVVEERSPSADEELLVATALVVLQHAIETGELSTDQKTQDLFAEVEVIGAAYQRALIEAGGCGEVSAARRVQALDSPVTCETSCAPNVARGAKAVGKAALAVIGAGAVEVKNSFEAIMAGWQLGESLSEYRDTASTATRANVKSVLTAVGGAAQVAAGLAGAGLASNLIGVALATVASYEAGKVVGQELRLSLECRSAKRALRCDGCDEREQLLVRQWTLSIAFADGSPESRLMPVFGADDTWFSDGWYNDESGGEFVSEVPEGVWRLDCQSGGLTIEQRYEGQTEVVMTLERSSTDPLRFEGTLEAEEPLVLSLTRD